MTTNDAELPGFYGKVASRGDFVSRRLPRSFLDPWDYWLQHGMSCSRDQLADNWLESYLTSPIWRFGLSAGICGDSAWVGILIPSVDNVGRYFPFTLASTLPPDANLIALLSDPADGWFTQAGQLALSSLDDEFEIEAFDAQLNTLGNPSPSTRAPTPTVGDPGTAAAFQYTLSSSAAIPSWSALTGHLLGAFLPQHSIWWSAGSDRVAPSLLVSEDLPQMQSFSALLDGQWSKRHWFTCELASGPEHPAPRDPDRRPPSVTRTTKWCAVSRTHKGMVREQNEDALIELSDKGIWAVADGMGGHVHGEMASHWVTDALRRIEPPDNLDDFIAVTSRQIEDVNASLRRQAVENFAGQLLGSTVVVLLALDERCACLWAGDSRAYLFRDNDLVPLTRDHSMVSELVSTGLLSKEQAANHPDANVVTRAVGGADELTLDVVKIDAQPTDAFVLCSDGLTNEVPEEEIIRVLRTEAPKQAVSSLVDLALDRGGHDNVTVVLVKACGLRAQRPEGQ